jgi:PAS domain S-box-containing protein
MRQSLHSIPVKICISILGIETLLLSLMGGYYVHRFYREIDQRVQEKLTLPSTLLSQRAMNYDSVRDLEVISKLVNEAVVRCFIVRKDGVVFFSNTPEEEGQSITALFDERDCLTLSWQGQLGDQVETCQDENKNYINHFAPIHYQEKLLGHIYTRILAPNIQREKQRILFLFVMGSLLTIGLTSFFEILFINRLLLPRLQKISGTLHKVEEGNLSAHVDFSGPQDELYILGRRVNTMIEAVDHSMNQVARTNELLLKSRERFQELADLLPETIYELDHEGRITYVNEKALELFGYSRTEMIGLSYTKLLAGMDGEELAEIFRDRINGDKKNIAEYIGKRKDGSTFPLHLNASPIYANGKTVGLRGILVDISEKKLLQDQLQQAQKMEVIEQLSASMAHEFGNPLIGVQWHLKYLARSPHLDDETHKMTRVAIEECKRMRLLLSDFQSFSKKSSGRNESVNINALLDNCLIFYKKYLKDHKIKVVRRYDESVPRIAAIKDQISQVFVNLLLNAVEAMEEEGGELLIFTENQGHCVAVKVQDTGSGIVAANLERIFEPFFSTKSEVVGTGLGLYVSYAIVQRHQGDIRIDSQPGQGSTFTVTLPVAS